MPGILTEPETGGGTGKIYLDESGGFFEVAVNSGAYTMLHKFHINPWGSGAGNAYNVVGASQEGTVEETVSNVIVELALFYPTTALLQCVGLWQCNSAHDAVAPVPSDVSAIFSNGTGPTGASNPDTLLTFTAHGSDFSRWQLRLHGVSATIYNSPGNRLPALGVAAPVPTLANYLTGQTAGPGMGGTGAGHFTQVCTHAGLPIVAPVYVLYGLSKRIRRRFRWA